MDKKWQKEVGNMTTVEQWKTLYDKKKDAGNISLWNHKNPYRGCSLLVELLPDILKKYKIKSFLDVGCSNRYWISTLDWSGIKYIGYDIVDGIIQSNISKYPEHEFKCVNLIEDKCPKVDMVFMRSVLIHTNLEDCNKILSNIKASGSKYLMVSTSPEIDKNMDTSCLWLVKRNLLLDPINLPNALEMIPEIKDVDKNNYMGIWEL